MYAGLGCASCSSCAQAATCTRPSPCGTPVAAEPEPQPVSWWGYALAFVAGAVVLGKRG